MSNLHTLTEAFTELERRADAVAERGQVDVLALGSDTRPENADAIALTPVPPRRRPGTLVLAGTAAAVVVAGLGTGATLLMRDSGPSAAGQPTAPQTPPTAAAPATATTTGAAGFHIPSNAEDLETRFRAVLNNASGLAGVTFTVTDTGSAVDAVVSTGPVNSPSSSASADPGRPADPVPTRAQATGYATTSLVPNQGAQNGAGIVGTLTAAAHSGGFDLQIFQGTPNGQAQCDDPDRSNCSVSTLPDGSSLALGQESIEGDGVTYQASLIRPDGAEFIMHVSNERDPKGASTLLSARPPLTAAQMTAILDSQAW